MIVDGTQRPAPDGVLILFSFRYFEIIRRLVPSFFSLLIKAIVFNSLLICDSDLLGVALPNLGRLILIGLVILNFFMAELMESWLEPNFAAISLAESLSAR